jgi:intracellular multiplication protein IcmP
MARSSGIGTGEKRSTDPFLFIAMCALAFVLLWVIWFKIHTEISTAYVYLRVIEGIPAWIVTRIADVPGLSAIADWIASQCIPAEGGIPACQRDFSTMTLPELTSSSVVPNLVCVGILIAIAVKGFLAIGNNHPSLRFARAHTLKSYLMESQAQYPHLRIFNQLDLVGAPLDDETLGMSLTSRRFAYHHQLISGWAEDEGDSWTPTLDRAQASVVFREQLGRHWTPRMSALTPGETLLMAIVMPRVAACDAAMDNAEFDAAMKASTDLITWCWAQFQPPADKKDTSLTWLKPDINLEYPRSIIKQYIRHPLVGAMLTRHAYVRTILYAMTIQARRLGVLPPTELRWMRFYDRGLWYVLQSIGRQAPFAEGAAVYSHYLYEAKSGRAIEEPQLDKALDALEVAMSAFKYSDYDKANYEEQIKEQLTTK